MRRYLLLRNNQQSGPYSKDELASIRLRSFDLVWQEGESQAWKYPTEIDELTNLVDTTFVSHPAGRTGGRNRIKENNIVAAPGRFEKDYSNASYVFPITGSYNEIRYQQSIDELKNVYTERWRKRKLWTRRLAPGNNLLTLFAVIIGVFLSAFLVKKGVDNFEIPLAPDEHPSKVVSNPLQTMQIPVNGKVMEYKVIRTASKETGTRNQE